MGGQRTADGRVDDAGEIVVLWRVGEDRQLLPADRQEHAPWIATDGVGRGLRIDHFDPLVSGLSRPRRAAQRSQRNGGLAAGRDGVGRHLVGIGMGRVDDGHDLLVAQMAHESVDSAEAPMRVGKACGAGCAVRPASDSVASKWVSSASRRAKRGGFGGAAEDENAHVGAGR